jgi:hypothetical protein
MTILGTGQPPFLERPDQSTLGVNRSCVGNLISRGEGRRYFEFFQETRLWTRSAATRVGGTRFRARTLFYCRRTELSRPARMCAPRPRRRGSSAGTAARTCRPYGAGLCQQHGATPSLYLMDCRTGGKSCRRQVTELGRVTGPLLPREQKIKEVFEQIPWGRSTDARKAIGAYNTGWYVRRLIARRLMRRIGRDKYELTSWAERHAS